MKSKKLLNSFVDFCNKHPELRFWQALRAWVGKGFVLVADSQDIVSDEWNNVQDTFYWEGKDK